MFNRKQSDSRDHSHGDQHTHGHAHRTIDPTVIRKENLGRSNGPSLIALTATALFQVIIVFLSGGVALLADTIHNVTDAATTIRCGSFLATLSFSPRHFTNQNFLT